MKQTEGVLHQNYVKQKADALEAANSQISTGLNCSTFLTGQEYFLFL